MELAPVFHGPLLAPAVAVKGITYHIPLGQPILVGHHSEKRARKDAQRIQDGLRKTVNLWESSKYWTDRAAGALANAAYKERPDVRHRRIKGLESDLRKQEKRIAEAEQQAAQRAMEGLSDAMAVKLAGYTSVSVLQGDGRYTSVYSLLANGEITTAKAFEHVLKASERTKAWAQRWEQHLSMRIAYERALLGEEGGLVADQFDIQVGGRVLVRGEWATVLRVNKREGKVQSVTTNARFVPVPGIEEISDYQAPAEGAVKVVKDVIRQPCW